MTSNYKFLPDPETGHLSEESTKRFFSTFGFAIFAMCCASFFAAYFLSYAAASIANAFAPHLLEDINFRGIVNTAVRLISYYAVALPIFLSLTKRLPKSRPFKAKMGFLKFLGGFCIAFLAMMVGNYISNAIIIFFESASGITTTNPIDAATEQGIAPIIYICILAPVLEEIFFRKIICDRLLPLGEGYAVFVSAVLFSLIHESLYQFAYAFFVGLIFAFIYVKTGRIKYNIVYHIVINTLGSVVAPYILEQIDLEKLTGMLETGVFDFEPRMIVFILILLAYEAIMTVVGIIGLVLVIKARYDKQLKLSEGIIPPPKKHRIANIFCTVGVAAAITYFVAAFILSMM